MRGNIKVHYAFSLLMNSIATLVGQDLTLTFHILLHFGFALQQFGPFDGSPGEHN